MKNLLTFSIFVLIALIITAIVVVSVQYFSDSYCDSVLKDYAQGAHTSPGKYQACIAGTKSYNERSNQ